LKANYSL